MYALDTNILIYHAAGDQKVADFFSQHRYEIFYVPSIVVVEFLSYPLITPDTAARFQNFIQQTILINLDYAIAERAAQMRRDSKIPLADAIVAASTLMTNSALVTRNIHDFKKVKGLAIVSP